MMKDTPDAPVLVTVRLADGAVQRWTPSDNITGWYITDSNVLVLTGADDAVIALYSPMVWMMVTFDAAS